MKRFLLALAFVVLAAVTAHARLGETVEEIAKRYGKSTTGLYPVEYVHRDYGDIQAWYEKDDLKLLVVFKDDKSQYEQVAKKDTTAVLSQSEIRAFLDANAGGSEWSRPRTTPSETTWIRKDAGARASLTDDGKALMVMITQGGSKGF